MPRAARDHVQLEKDRVALAQITDEVEEELKREELVCVERPPTRRCVSYNRYPRPETHTVCMVCHAPCCTKMIVVLERSEEEKYPVEYVRDYKRPRARARLKRRSDGSCIYFNKKTARCARYGSRPLACRQFFCGRGVPFEDRVWLDLGGEPEVGGG